MSETQEARRGRGRREELPEEWRDRQRRASETDLNGVKLPIPDWVYEKYPRTMFRHRWFRAESGRMYSKTKSGDWDPVEGVDAVPGAHDQHGNPVDHVLCVTRLDWWKADRARMEDARQQLERDAVRGLVKGKSVATDGSVTSDGGSLSPDVSYASASNRLS